MKGLCVHPLRPELRASSRARKRGEHHRASPWHLFGVFCRIGVHHRPPSSAVPTGVGLRRPALKAHRSVQPSDIGDASSTRQALVPRLRVDDMYIVKGSTPCTLMYRKGNLLLVAAGSGKSSCGEATTQSSIDVSFVVTPSATLSPPFQSFTKIPSLHHCIAASLRHTWYYIILL